MAHEGLADSLTVKHPGQMTRYELVQETMHKKAVAPSRGAKQGVMKVDASKGAVMESCAPESLFMSRAWRVRRMFRQ
jgi:hypothetical protein